jgi:hypothetical protein
LGRDISFQCGTVGSAMLFSLILLAFFYVQFFGYDAVRQYGQSWKTVMAVNAIFFFILLCF